jgi:hypothetical protein
MKLSMNTLSAEIQSRTNMAAMRTREVGTTQCR